MKLGIRVVQML